MKSWLCKCGRKNDLTSTTCIYCEAKSTVVEKKPVPLKRVGTVTMWQCSNGLIFSEQQIRYKISKCYEAMDNAINSLPHVCAAYGCHSDDHDHTISKARCKQLKKTELIWDPRNIEYSSRQAHQEWESYKSGEFLKHKNFESRMAYVKKHDIEMWEKRMQVWEQYTKPTNTI